MSIFGYCLHAVMFTGVAAWPVAQTQLSSWKNGHSAVGSQFLSLRLTLERCVSYSTLLLIVCLVGEVMIDSVVTPHSGGRWMEGTRWSPLAQHSCCWGGSVLVGWGAVWNASCTRQCWEANVPVQCGGVQGEHWLLGAAYHTWNTSTGSMGLFLCSCQEWPVLLWWWVWSQWLLPQQCSHTEHPHSAMEDVGPHNISGWGTNEEA